MVGGGSCEIFRPRPRVRPVGAASGPDPCQFGHRPRRAARVPDPRRHQGTSRAAIARPVVSCDDPEVFGAPFTGHGPHRRAPNPVSGAQHVGRRSRVARAGAGGTHRRPSSPSTPSIGAPAGLGDLGPPPKNCSQRSASAHRGFRAAFQEDVSRRVRAALPAAGESTSPADQARVPFSTGTTSSTTSVRARRTGPMWPWSTGRWRPSAIPRRPGLGAHLPSRAEGTMRLGMAREPPVRPGATSPSKPDTGRALYGGVRDATRPPIGWYDVFSRWKLAIVFEGSTPSSCGASPDKPIHEYFGAQADLLLASAAAISDRGDMT